MITSDGQDVYHDTEDGRLAKYAIDTPTTHIVHRDQAPATAIAAGRRGESRSTRHP